MKGYRSHTYQWKIAELPYANEVLSLYSNQQGLRGKLSPAKYSEKILELYDEVKAEFWQLAKEELTEIQFSTIRMLADGYTQQEIAKIRGCNQSVIAKCCLGQSFTDEEGRVRYHGGAFPKLKQLVKESQKIQALLTIINELTEENY